MATDIPATLAIDGGKPLRKQPFPRWPVFGQREEDLLLEVLHSGKWGETDGSKVKEFAKLFPAFQGAAWGVCVPNGTVALELALDALGVGYGDEVITTAYTFIATAAAAFAVGAKPVFVDIDPATNLIDPAKIEAAITPRTKAIVPVHIGGHPADMDGVMEIARKHGLKVLEDAAQAWGAQWKGKGVGAIGDLGTFSFQSSKNITSGEGGIIVTDQRELYDICWSMHNVGRLPEGGWYQHELLGKNLRLSEWAGAVLIAQLERYPEAMDTRSRNAARLNAEIADLPGLTPLTIDPRTTRSGWHLYQVTYDPAALGGKTRAEFIAALQAEGVPCSSGYVPLIHQSAIRNTLRDRFGAESLENFGAVPNADRAGETTIWLHQQLLLGTDEDTSDIIAAMAKITRAWAS